MFECEYMPRLGWFMILFLFESRGFIWSGDRFPGTCLTLR